MNTLKRAVILAAGFGTRLLPLTRVVPKPLLPLGGVPMLDRALALVRSWGVREVLVNVHHQAGDLVRHLVTRAPDGLRVSISFEPEILGTGGALTRASWFLGDGAPFWMVNADVATAVDGRRIARAFRPGRTIAAAWLMASRGPRTVACQRGVITDFQSKQPRSEGTYTFCGVHLVDPAVLRYLPPQGFASIIDAYRRAMDDGWTVAGVPIEDAYWADIGTPAQYVQAERDVGPARPGRAGRTRRAGVAIVNGFIYGPQVPRRRYTGIMAVRAEDALDDAERALLRTAALLQPGTIACPLSPRGSARSFTRIYQGSRTAMLVRHKPDREENNLYVGHTRFLRTLDLPVPEVLAEDPAAHLALFSDVGVDSVQDRPATWRATHLGPLYRSVLARMVVFHEEGARAAKRRRLRLMPEFDAALYEWEHDLFARLFLRGHLGIDSAREQAIRAELKTVSNRLLALPRVLLHRDFQSSNILLNRSGWALIDYQGMRLGPAVYDLASLLCDPYIAIAPAQRSALLDHYARRADPRAAVHQAFWPAAIQRLGQALGAYARLGAAPGTERFLRYIPPALANLDDAVRRVDGLPELSALVHDVRQSKPRVSR